MTPIPAPSLSSRRSTIDSTASTPDASPETPLPDAGMENDEMILGENGRLGERVKEKEKGKMGPPPLPLNIVGPTPTRTTRLPSLKQLSDKYHSSTLSAHPPSPTTLIHPSNQPPTTPPKLQVSTQTNSPHSNPLLRTPTSLNPHPGTTTTSPFTTSSPSSRLRLPASAMLRTSSGTCITALFSPNNPTFRDITPSAIPKGLFDTTDPFAVPLPSPKSAIGSSTAMGMGMARSQSKDGYIKGYRDIPSLAALRHRASISKGSGVGIAGETIKESPSPGDTSIPNADATPPAVEVAAINKSITPKANTGIDTNGNNNGIDTVQEKEADKVIPAHQMVSDVTISPPSSATSSTSSEPVKGKEHPLQHAWTLYYDSKTYKPDPTLATPKEGQAFLGDYEKGLLTVGRFDTVEGFARYLNNVRLPSLLSRNSNYHLFKNGIRPMWEDPANANGGKWVLLLRNAPHILDMAWANLTMSLIGEILDPQDQVCGIVASTRPKIDRIQIWTRGRDDIEGINGLGRRIIESVGLEGRDVECLSLEFQFNASNSTPPPGRFLNIPFPAQRASFSHAPPTPSRLSSTITLTPSLNHGNASPVPPRSPISGEYLIPVPNPNSNTNGSLGRESSPRRMGSNAFAGPMGGGMGGMGSRNGSFSGGTGRRESQQNGVMAGTGR